jgi:pyruvate/2-oxoglutarate/acetoin dehydrogenase E1 component
MPMRELMFNEAINEGLRLCMQEDETVILLGEDIGPYGGLFQVTAGLLDEFGPERVRDTPISEAGFVGAAIGAAMTGLRPVAEVGFLDLTTVCMDMIINQMAKMRWMFGGQCRVPMVLRMSSGPGRSAAAQHSQNFYSFFMHIPGLCVIAPSTPYDAKGLIIEAVKNDNPIIFAEHKGLYFQKGDVPEETYTIPLGQADVKSEGRDVTIVATQVMVGRSIEAAGECAKEGIEVEVIDPRTLDPLDAKTILDSVKKTGRLIVADEDYKTCGVGSAISAMAAEEAIWCLKAPILRICPKDTPVPYAPALEKVFVPNVNDLIDAIRKVMAYA